MGGFNGFYGNGLIVGGFNGFCGKNINCGDFIYCGRLSSLLWVVLNAICQIMSENINPMINEDRQE